MTYKDCKEAISWRVAQKAALALDVSVVASSIGVELTDEEYEAVCESVDRFGSVIYSPSCVARAVLDLVKTDETVLPKLVASPATAIYEDKIYATIWETLGD